MTKAVLIHTSGKIELINANTLEDFQLFVGRYIEGLPFNDVATSYINEEGKQLKLPLNYIATKLCFSNGIGLAEDDCIVGNMIVLGVPDAEGNDTDIPNELAERLLNLVL